MPINIWYGMTWFGMMPPVRAEAPHGLCIVLTCKNHSFNLSAVSLHRVLTSLPRVSLAPQHLPDTAKAKINSKIFLLENRVKHYMFELITEILLIVSDSSDRPYTTQGPFSSLAWMRSTFTSKSPALVHAAVSKCTARAPLTGTKPEDWSNPK